MANLLTVQMFNTNTSASTNGISPKFKVSNTGSTPVNLSDVKLRYYYTIDGEKAQNFWCDYAALISGNNYAGITDKVTGAFVRMNPSVIGADYYLEIGFKSDAGTLAVGASTEIQVRFAKSDWTNYNQSDDYSFNSSASQPVDWDKVTGYVGTTKVWGKAPNEIVTIDSKIDPTTASFDKNVAKQADIPVTMTLNGNTFVSISNVASTNYTVANNVVTIKKSYLATLAKGTVVLTFNFSAGNAQTLTILISDSTIIPSFALSIGSASVKAGESVTIPVSLTGVPAGYVDNCDFQIGYDASIFETVSVAAGDITVNPSVNFSTNVDSTNGVIYVLYTDSKQDGTEAVQKDGVFANITLKVKSTAAAGTTPISVKSLGGFTDKDLNTITVTATNGVITILGGNPGPVDSIIVPTTASFDKNVAKQADIAVTMTLNGNTFVSISNVASTNYTVANNVVTIKKSYLETLVVGSAVLTFNFSAGNSQTLTITVSDSTPSSLEVSIGSASVKAGESVTIPVSFKGVPAGYVDNCDFQISYDTSIFETVSVAAGDITVNPSVNFSTNVDSANGLIYVLYTDNKQDGTEAVKQDGVFANITLKVKSTAAEGTSEIKVKSLGGFTDKDLNTIAVKATSGVITIVAIPIVHSTIVPTVASFDKNVAKQADIAVTMTLNGNTLVSIKNGTTVLTQSTDYTVANNVVTIKKSYLSTLAIGNVSLTFDFSAGNAPTLTIAVSDSTVVVIDSKIVPTTAAFDKNVTNQADIAVTMTLNGNTFVSISNVASTNYTIANNVVTIKKSYLATLAIGSAVLTFNFSAGNAQTLTVTVSDSTPIPDHFTVGIGSASLIAGASVTIPVTFDGIPAGYVDNCDFQLSYDTSIFETVSVAAGDITVNPAVNFSSNVNTTNGVIYVLYTDNKQDGTEAVKQDGVFANITVKVKSTAMPGTTGIKVKSLGGFTDKDLNTIPVTATNGVITIQ